MRSLTYGEVDMKQIARIIADRVQGPGQYNVMVGTDSQNFDKTKVVVVITFHHAGHGGIFFYDITRVPIIKAVGPKLQYETSLSLEYAQRLIEAFDELFDETGFDYTQHINFGIHVDAGPNGKSCQVIPEIVGWITSMGYKVVTKPDSYAASSVANMLSK